MRNYGLGRSPNSWGRPNNTVHGDQIPSEFRPLQGLARIWAIADESERCEFMESTSLRARREMVGAVLPHFETLEAWISAMGRTYPVCREVRELELLLVAATEAMLEVYLGE